MDHIGIAVESLSDSIPRFARLVGCAQDEARITEVPEEDVRIAELTLRNVELELLEPLSEDSPVGAFLKKRGEGLHHLCYEVEDIHATWENLKAAGFQLLSSEVKTVRGYSYFFVHPRSAGGILTEFKQKRTE